MESSRAHWRDALHENGGAWTVEVVGGLLALSTLAHALTNPDPLPVWVVESILVLVFSSAFVYLGYRLGTSDHAPAQQWRVAQWTMVGVAMGALLASWVVLHQFLEGVVVAERTYPMLTTAAVGGLAGFFGCSARGVDREPAPVAAGSDSESDPGGDSTSRREIDSRSVRGAVSASVGRDVPHLSCEETRRPSRDASRPDPRSRSVALARLDVDPVRRWLASKTPTESETRRLLILEYFKERPAVVVTVDELAAHVLEADAAIRRRYDHEDLVLRLRHVDVPHLADVGVLSYGPSPSP